MSWLFSRALVEEYLAECLWDGGLSLLLKSTPSEQAYSSHGNRTAFFHPSPSGTTCARLTAFHGEVLLMWYLGDFLAQTSPQADLEPGCMEREVDFTERRFASLVKFDLSSPSLKTVHCSLEGASNTCFLIWPRWGMMRDGECWEQMQLEPTIRDTESSLWHPTPTKGDSKGCTNRSAQRIGAHYLKDWILRRFPSDLTTYPHPGFLEQAMGWPSGWTRLQPLGTAKFQQWLDSHGKP